MPYRAHLVLDVLGRWTALASPWVFGVSGHARARTAFLAIGAFGLMAGLLSGPEDLPEG